MHVTQLCPGKGHLSFTPTKLRPRHESKMLVPDANHMVPVYANISHRARCYLPVLLSRYQAERFHSLPDESVERPLAFPLAEENVRSSAQYTGCVVLVLDPAEGEGVLLTSIVG